MDIGQRISGMEQQNKGYKISALSPKCHIATFGAIVSRGEARNSQEYRISLQNHHTIGASFEGRVLLV